MMRALGYSRPISVENFRNPNFELVADVLRWLVNRYEPTAEISNEVGNMQDRVIFLKQAASLMQAKGRIKLNTKRLYQADGYAVKELIKVAQVLYNAMKSNPDEDDDVMGVDAFSLKLNDLREVRDLASEITQHGAALSELLTKEDQLREARVKAVSRNAEMADIEKIIKHSIASAEDNKQNKEKMMEELGTDEKALRKKMEKKKAELERNEKRFSSLQTVRPAFMDEYEKLEEELHDLFREYLERYRNLDYIESQLEQFNKQEQERIDDNERQMKRMQKKIKDEELKVLRGDIQLDENELDDSLLDDASSDDDEARSAGGRGGSGGNIQGSERPKTKSGARQNKGLNGGSDAAEDKSASESEASVESEDNSGDLLDEDSDQGSGSGSEPESGESGGSSVPSDDSDNSF